MAEQIDGRTLRYQHRRSELLDAVGEYVLDHGIATLSLRRVAH
jgi:DNA-binding transcriptional regulator YbjK